MIFVLRMIFSFIRFINAALIKEEKLVSVFFIGWHFISDGFSSHHILQYTLYVIFIVYIMHCI